MFHELIRRLEDARTELHVVKSVIKEASKEARIQGHTRLDTRHLALALLCQTMREQGEFAEIVTAKLKSLQEARRRSGEIQLLAEESSSIKDWLSCAFYHAYRKRGARSVDTVDLYVALMQGSGLGKHLMLGLGFSEQDFYRQS